MIFGSNASEFASDSTQICPTAGLDGASAEYVAPFTSSVFKVVGLYVVPPAEYNT